MGSRSQPRLRIVPLSGVKAASISPTDWDLYQELRKEDKISVHLFAIWLGGTTTDSTADTLKRINALPHPPGPINDDVLISGGVSQRSAVR